MTTRPCPATPRAWGWTKRPSTRVSRTQQAQNEVDYATAFGQEIGVPTMPSFLVLKIGANGKAENSEGLPGAQTLEQIEQAIQKLQAPPTAAPTPVAIAPEKLASLQVGVDADGNFYRGDPNAPIKLVDFSDFQ